MLPLAADICLFPASLTFILGVWQLGVLILAVLEAISQELFRVKCRGVQHVSPSSFISLDLQEQCD